MQTRPEGRRQVVILGAGFGGLELATRLSEDLAGEVDVVLIDRNDSFVFGFSKLDVMFGRETPDAVRSYYRDIAKEGVEFRREEVLAIDAANRRVTTDHGSYDADILVVALGADLDPSATPGFTEGGHDFYSVEGAERLREVIPAFTEGSVVLAILGPFFKCPPAPFEAAFMLHDSLVERGVRDSVGIRILSPLPSPIPVSPDTSAAILAGLAERNIEFWSESVLKSVDGPHQMATLANGRVVWYDLLLGVPVHKAPQVVVDSGLTVDGWIPVDPATFATAFPGVYAVGDITSAPVPRAGVFAEGEAGTVADVIVAELHGGDGAQAYAGAGSCYIEFGGGEVARVDVNFLGGPKPTAAFNRPSAELAEEKRRFGSSRRHRWFG